MGHRSSAGSAFFPRRIAGSPLLDTRAPGDAGGRHRQSGALRLAWRPVKGRPTFLVLSEDAQGARQRIVEAVDDAFLRRDDDVVGDVREEFRGCEGTLEGRGAAR